MMCHVVFVQIFFSVNVYVLSGLTILWFQFHAIALPVWIIHILLGCFEFVIEFPCVHSTVITEIKRKNNKINIHLKNTTVIVSLCGNRHIELKLISAC